MASQIKKYKRIIRRDKIKDEKAQYILRWAKKLKAIQNKGGKCLRCGCDNPICLSFHHKTADKDKSIADLSARRAKWSKIKNEIKKCDLLCHNCHRELHFEKEQNKRQRKNKDICLEFIKQLSCKQCGYNHCNAALDFHHTANTKKQGVVKYSYNHSWKTIDDLQEDIRKELKKCIVLCANCHKLLHFDFVKFSTREKEIRKKMANLKERNVVDAAKVVSLGKQGTNRFAIAKLLSCSPCRVYEILKANTIL
jgi:hypothetical protein